MGTVVKASMEITETKVFPILRPLSDFKAMARVVLNHSLVLNGLKIKKGEFGHFVSFPRSRKNSPYRQFEPLSGELRKKINHSVLREYAKALTRAPII